MARIAKDLSLSRTREIHLKTPASTGEADMPRVAIIGAGLSGLRCAALLARSRCQVTVYEARNRVGGRVHQDLNDGHMVDMGSNWIHGTQGNPMSKLAKKTGTVVWTPDERSLVIDENGVRRSEGESGEMSEEFWGQVVQAFKYADQHSPEISPKTSLKEFLQHAWQKKYPKQPQKVKDLLNESAVWGQFVGGRVETQSLKFFWLEECLEGENVFVASTYHKILAQIADPVLNDSTGNLKLRLNDEVARIRYRESGQQQSVYVTTKDGESEEFDEIVVTCPLGWLKHNKDQVFEPTLPTRLAEAIDNIGYGALEKLYISFSEPWWLKRPSGAGTPAASLPDSPASMSQAQSTPSDQSSEAVATAVYPPIVSLHSPKYHPISQSASSLSFNQSVISLAHLSHGTDHATLLFYMSGDASQYLTHALAAHKKNSLEHQNIMRSFAAPFLSRFPNFDPQDPKCTPTSYLATSWSTDEFAGYGSYSNFPVGLEHADEDIECMRNGGGLGENGKGLWFAGEHTAPFVALGTTTGAYWSGEGIARRMCRHYGIVMAEDEFSSDIEVMNHEEEQNGDRSEGAEDGRLGKTLAA